MRIYININFKKSNVEEDNIYIYIMTTIAGKPRPHQSKRDNYNGAETYIWTDFTICIKVRI